jgi:hypothetical protein
VLRKIFGPKQEEMHETGGGSIVRSFMIAFLTSYLGNQIKEDEVIRACGVHGGEEKCIQCSGRRTLRKEVMRSNLEEELFATLVPLIFLFKTRHCAGERRSITLEMGVEFKYLIGWLQRFKL